MISAATSTPRQLVVVVARLGWLMYRQRRRRSRR